MRYASVRVLFCLVMACSLTVGCAGGEELEPIGECESNVDCGANEVCDLSTNTCEPLRSSNNSDNSTTPSNLGMPDTGFNPGDDSGTTEPDMDTSCGDTCASDEVCMAGQCVSACPDGCGANQMCTANGCVFAECAAEGDPCNPEMGDQGEFLCLTNENDEGVCARTCEESLSVSNCGTGQYCLAVSQDGQFKACLDSTCSSSSECNGGTCIDFGNDFGTCFSAGPLAVGDACNVRMGDDCVAGAFCRVTDSASGAGVCSAVCDPWAATSDCPAGQACGSFLTWRTGLCTDELDPVASQPFQTCSASGTACGDGIRCLSTGTQNVCFQYCRPGSNDCVGILPNGTDGRCNNYAFYGNREIGLCVGPCASDGDCGADGRCVDDVCRGTCTVAGDCCSDPTNCEAACVNGLCE